MFYLEALQRHLPRVAEGGRRAAELLCSADPCLNSSQHINHAQCCCQTPCRPLTRPPGGQTNAQTNAKQRHLP